MIQLFFILLLLLFLGYFGSRDLAYLILFTLSFVGLARLTRAVFRSRSDQEGMLHRIGCHLVAPLPIMALYALLGFIHGSFNAALVWGSFLAYLPIPYRAALRGGALAFFSRQSTAEERARLSHLRNYGTEMQYREELARQERDQEPWWWPS